MTATGPQRKGPFRKGWCPGAMRAMPAKDGFLLRLRVSGGVLSSATMRRLARAGRDHGNGLFDLSSRGNLQLRGMSEHSLPVLRKILDGLGLLDRSAAAEAIRNVMTSPLAGIDAPIDVTQIAKSLESALVRQTQLYGLPGKFGFLIDDGGALSLAHIPADVRFDYCAMRNAFAVRIGGISGDGVFLGDCEPGEVVDIALRLATAFVRLAPSMREPPLRMRELLRDCEAGSIAAAAGLRLAPPPKREPAAEPCPIGLVELGGEKFCFGAGAAFGRFDAAMVETIARAAEIFANGELRLTPWRVILLPSIDAERDKALQAHFAAENFIIDPADPRLAVAACGGALACVHGSTPTHADALTLAPVARRLQAKGVALHVSGCAKGCARQAPTPYTLVARAERYDLIANGAPQDASAAQDLTLAEAQYMLEKFAGKAETGCELEHS